MKSSKYQLNLYDRTCSKCYSSGVSLVLDEENFEMLCDKCRN